MDTIIRGVMARLSKEITIQHNFAGKTNANEIGRHTSYSNMGMEAHDSALHERSTLKKPAIAVMRSRVFITNCKQ